MNRCLSVVLFLLFAVASRAAAEEPSVVLDSSLGVSSPNGLMGGVSATIAPSGSLLQSGWRLNVSAGGGGYTYSSALDGTSLGTYGNAGILIGYSWNEPSYTIAGFLGPSITSSRSFGDSSVSSSETDLGLGAVLSLSVTPNAFSMLVTQASYSTAQDSYSLYGRLGLSAFEGTFIGPELSFSGSDFYQQARIGGHISGISLGSVQLSAYGGYLTDLDGEAGGYFGLSASKSF
jgi:hypothetical protein